MTTPKLDPTLDRRARELARTGNAVGWGVADLALEYKRKGEPYWAARIGKPFGVRERWAQTLARTAEFCEVDCVKKLRPRQNLRVTHWAAIAAYWEREGVEIEQLVEIASDAIDEAPTVTVQDVEEKLRGLFGFEDVEIPARRVTIYSKQLYSWAEQRGPNDALYSDMIDVAERLRSLAERMRE